MNQELQSKTITITGISSKMFNQSTVYTLEADREKFQFWSKKQDGSDTKAYQQFQQFRFQSGDQVTISYKSEPQSFVNQQGKTINFNRNTIVFFITDSEGNPEQKRTQQPSTPQGMAQIEKEDWEKLVKNFNHLGRSHKEALDRIKELERKVSGLWQAHLNDPATQLHTIPLNEEIGNEFEKAVEEKKAMDRQELELPDINDVPFL